MILPIGIVAALIWFAIHLEFPTCTFRYKLTAEVMTPDGLKTGSSVVDVTYDHSGDYGGGQQPYLKMVGDAVYLELGNKKNLVVTFSTWGEGKDFLRGSAGLTGYFAGVGRLNVYALPLRMFGLKWKFGSEDQLCRDYASLGLGKKVDVPFVYLPTIVTFGDIHNPDTSKVVKPNEFGAEFDSGYELKRVTVETTNEPIVQGIENVLDWLPEKKKYWQQHPIYRGLQVPLINNLGYDAFKGPGLFGNGAML